MHMFRYGEIPKIYVVERKHLDHILGQKRNGHMTEVTVKNTNFKFTLRS